MKSVLELHRKAMGYAETAFIALNTGDYERAKQFYYEALQLERDAAKRVAKNLSAEPTRSVLYRSAASMAMNCGELSEAERLIATALSGEPPAEIADELRTLLEDVHFHRHLENRGITLDPNEFEVSLVGRGVGAGMVESEQFFSRIRNTDTLIHRVAQRKNGFPFKDQMSKKNDAVGTFIGVPRAACFAVTFRIGTPDQMAFPGIGLAVDVIEELLTCLELLERTEGMALKERIQDDAYYNNFVALAGQIAPDGEDISKVIFTAAHGGGTRHAILSRQTSNLLSLEKGKEIGVERSEERGVVTIIGKLNYADSRTNKPNVVMLEDMTGKSHRVIVPKGMMADIVKPLYEAMVTVTGRPKGKSIEIVTPDGIKEVES